MSGASELEALQENASSMFSKPYVLAKVYVLFDPVSVGVDSRVALRDIVTFTPEIDVTSGNGVTTQLLYPGSADYEAAFGAASVSNTTALRRAVFDVIPESFTVERNSMRCADTCVIRFPFIDMPFNPSAIKSIAVALYAYAFSPDEIGDSEKVRSIIAGLQPVFSGWADSERVSFQEDGATISIDSHDLTGLLLQLKIFPALQKQINLSYSDGGLLWIEDAVAQVINAFRTTMGTPIYLKGFAPKTIAVKSSVTARAGSSRRTGKKATVGHHPMTKGETVWDYITQLTVPNGLIAYVEPNIGMNEAEPIQRIVLSLPGDLRSSVVVEDGVTFVYSTLINAQTGEAKPTNKIELTKVRYGMDMNSEVTREFGVSQVPAVEMRCWNLSTRKVMAARFPPKDIGSAKVDDPLYASYAPDATAEYREVSGEYTDEELLALARRTFMDMASCHTEIQWSTDVMSSTGNGPDRLRLGANSPLQLEFEKDSISVFGARALAGLSSETDVEDSDIPAGMYRTTGADSNIWYSTGCTLSYDGGFTVSGTAVTYLGLDDNGAHDPAVGGTTQPEQERLLERLPAPVGLLASPPVAVPAETTAVKRTKATPVVEKTTEAAVDPVRTPVSVFEVPPPSGMSSNTVTDSQLREFSRDGNIDIKRLDVAPDDADGMRAMHEAYGTVNESNPIKKMAGILGYKLGLWLEEQKKSDTTSGE